MEIEGQQIHVRRQYTRGAPRARGRRSRAET